MSVAQVRTTPTQVPNVTAPGPQQPAQSQLQRQQPLSGAKAPQPILQTPGAGTVEGFVYWDTASVSHTPASTCSGLAVTVAVGNSSGGESNAYQPLATLTNNFKFVGQVKQFLVGGKIKVYDVCTDGYGHVPVGPDLRVTVLAEGASPSQAGPFSPASVPQVDPIGPVTIVNGQCNMLPRIVNPTASDLFAHWGSCQNMAYDVNFMMQPAQKVLSSGGSGLSSARGAQGGMLSGSTQQQGMLTSGAGPSTQSQSTQGSLLGNRGQASPSINGGTRQTYTGTTRPSGALTGPGGRVLTNADVIKLVRAGIPEDTIMKSIQSARKQFDFSAAGCRALQQANVSAIIVVAMGDGSVGPCPAITGSGGINGPGVTDPNRRSITDITNRGTSAPATPGRKVELNPQPFPTKMVNPPGTGASKVELNPQPFPQRTGNNLASQASPDLQRSSRQALANADVIRMLNQGLPESVIVHTIQSSTKQFDFSREGMQALQQAHVSPAVLAAMCDGSARGCTEASRSRSLNGSGFTGPNRQAITDITNRGTPSVALATPANKVELNPQPFPQRVAANSAFGSPGASGSLNPQPLPTGRKGATPALKIDPKNIHMGERVTNSAVATSAVIVNLKMQRQAADLEAAQTLSAPGKAPSTAVVLNTPASNTGVTGIQNASVVTVPGNGLRNPCSVGQPRITSVNRSVSNLSSTANPAYSRVVFTQDPNYNHYAISGCGFGTVPGRIYLIAVPIGFPGHGGNITLLPAQGQTWGNQWSDTFIDAQVDPSISGELDQSNVSLVIQAAAGGQAQANGFSFYAKRGPPIPLNPARRGEATIALYDSVDTRYASPVTTNDCWCLPGPDWVALVEHLSGFCKKSVPDYSGCNPVKNQYGQDECEPTQQCLQYSGAETGTDVFDLNLRPGFVVDSAQTGTVSSDGMSLQVQASDTQIRVANVSPSYGWYILKVWVVGPAGFSDPWPSALLRQQVTQVSH